MMKLGLSMFCVCALSMVALTHGVSARGGSDSLRTMARTAIFVPGSSASVSDISPRTASPSFVSISRSSPNVVVFGGSRRRPSHGRHPGPGGNGSCYTPALGVVQNGQTARNVCYADTGAGIGFAYFRCRNGTFVATGVDASCRRNGFNF